jgi:hypothetical protein
VSTRSETERLTDILELEPGLPSQDLLPINDPALEFLFLGGRGRRCAWGVLLKLLLGGHCSRGGGERRPAYVGCGRREAEMWTPASVVDQLL